MFSSVTSWFGGDEAKEGKKVSEADDREKSETADKGEQKEEKADTEKSGQPGAENAETKETTNKGEEEDDSLEKAIEDASAKAINTAKEWGSYLYSFSKTASKTVAEKAKQFSKQVEEKTFLGDFSKEQEKFMTEQKERAKHAEAAVPPWVGYNEEETMKSQMLALSQEKRNFLRNPPAGVQYQFDFDSMFPVALATLQEDPNLQKMRFELVPKQIKEEMFWRNYFYRVSLIKQSTQLTSLAQETGSTGESKSSDGSRRSSIGNDEKEHSNAQQIKNSEQKDEDFEPSSPNDNEFISDSFQTDQINDEEIQKDLQMLRVDESKPTKTEQEEDTDNIPQWEKELQQELQDYEMVGDTTEIDDADIENEILQQIEQETKSM